MRSTPALFEGLNAAQRIGATVDSETNPLIEVTISVERLEGGVEDAEICNISRGLIKSLSKCHEKAAITGARYIIRTTDRQLGGEPVTRSLNTFSLSMAGLGKPLGHIRMKTVRLT